MSLLKVFFFHGGNITGARKLYKSLICKINQNEQSKEQEQGEFWDEV